MWLREKNIDHDKDRYRHHTAKELWKQCHALSLSLTHSDVVGRERGSGSGGRGVVSPNWSLNVG